METFISVLTSIFDFGAWVMKHGADWIKPIWSFETLFMATMLGAMIAGIAANGLTKPRNKRHDGPPES